MIFLGSSKDVEYVKGLDTNQRGANTPTKYGNMSTRRGQAHLLDFFKCSLSTLVEDFMPFAELSKIIPARPFTPLHGEPLAEFVLPVLLSASTGPTGKFGP